MKREEFKKLIKESVKEVLIEEGVLSTIVSEVMKGANTQLAVQAIGETSYNGVNLFEGTNPLNKGGAPGAAPTSSPLANIEPGDAGVDISSLLGKKEVWKKLT